MDSISDSDSEDAGSIPAGTTKQCECERARANTLTLSFPHSHFHTHSVPLQPVVIYQFYMLCSISKDSLSTKRQKSLMPVFGHLLRPGD